MHGKSKCIVMSEGIIAYPYVAIWYTDGSGLNRFGTSVFGPKYNHRESSLMGSLYKVFQTEMMAVLRCTELLLYKNATVRRYEHICCDSRAVIRALAKTTIESTLVWESKQALEKLSGSNKVTLVWVLGIMEYR